MPQLEVHVEYGKCSFEIEDDEEMVAEETDSKTVLDPESIPSGNLYFDKHRRDGKHIPFLLTSHSIDMEKFMTELFDAWEISFPRIILYVIADTDDSPSNQYRKLSRKLVKGLLHALNTAEMWVCIDAINHGFSRDVAYAFQGEISRRKTLGSGLKKIDSGFSETALIGICKRNSLTFSEKFDPHKSLETLASKPIIKRDLNRRCDYLIFVEDSTETSEGLSKFLLNFAHTMSTHGSEQYLDEKSENAHQTPVIALLLQGSVMQIDLVLGHVKHGLPLVVFEGSGGLADLIAYAYQQAKFRPEGINIAEYTESVLKPQISDKMHEMYPDYPDFKISSLTEKVFDCIRSSTLRDQDFITVLNIGRVDFQSSSLLSHLLEALFKSDPADSLKGVGQMKRSLFLAMDWNSADVAREEVFARDSTGKFQIDEEIFFRALTKPKREDFVSLFLNQGFKIHKYLNSSSLIDLFSNSLKKEFFKGVLWESVLGFGSNTIVTRNFLDSKLIILIEELTGIPSLVNSYELDWNSRAIYDDRTSHEAERKALAVLALWAILSYRVALVKTLWRHSEQPIHLALACSIILKKLEAFVTDLSLKHEMEKESKEFSKMAVNVMTLCYDAVPCRALDVLDEKNRVWSFKVLMELAAFSKNKMFLAHPCCQKYLDNLFMGHIKIRDLPYGDTTIPLWIKIILSAFFIFPMFLWVRFELPEQHKKSEKKPAIATSLTNQDITSKEKNQSGTSSTNMELKSNEPDFFKKIYYVWSAPITKFWVYQVFYILFLLLFSLAVIWPACGNIFLDFFTCIWIAIIILDCIYHVYTLNMKYTSMPLVYKCLEVSVMILFLFSYSMGRIFWKHSFMTPYSAKVMLCIALLYFYYRLIFISLPISSELGPMLFRVSRMVSVDFVSYIRIAILVVISNGIVIHAIVYPDHPLNWTLFRKAFYDALISFFLSPQAAYIGDPDEKCIRLRRDPNNSLTFIGMPRNITCKVGRYFKPSCPNPGVWPYLFAIQYLIILKLNLLVMLFALFSNTQKKLEEEGKYIWKYQRYALVINFSNRLTLPPPLSIITLVYIFFNFLFYCICDYADRYVLKYSKLKGIKRVDDSPAPEMLDEDDFRYWKNLAMAYHTNKLNEKAEEMTTKKRMDRVDALAGALNKQRRDLRDLEGHLNELHLQIMNAHQYLEGAGVQVSVRERLQAKNVPHMFSRISPYPNTRISRFPVSDNHVSWKCIWSQYDPISFTLPKDEFPPQLRPHVDVDLQRQREKEKDAFRMPDFNWNVISLSPGGVFLDRKSWITDKSDRTVQYELDSENLPKNPLGRTGLKGRGYLPRWGPNHYIYVIITRWHKQDEFLYHNRLDVVLMSKDGDFGLPGGYVHTENKYEIIQSLFHTEGLWREDTYMVEYFESLRKGEVTGRSSVWMTENKDKSDEEVPFFAEIIKCGYLDEETNTDQAWCEAEVWHIHYNTQSTIEEKFKADMDWYMLNMENLMKVPIGQSAMMHTVSKKMKSVLEIE